jgi:DNA-directed RNA polymerase subunit RPC12/RpoP
VTIEFSCQHCGKALSTSDDKAGRKAKCPGCGEAVLVPSPAVEATNDDTDWTATTADMPDVTCPMCGATNPGRAKACESCGEPLPQKKSQKQPLQSGAFDVGQVVSRTWDLFKQEMGLVVAAQICFGILTVLAIIPVFGTALFFVAFQEQEQFGLAIGMLLLTILFGLLAMVGLMWIDIGRHQLMLKVVRRQEAALGDLFSGPRVLGRWFLCNVIYNILSQVGAQLCIIPGILVFLFLWPFGYLLIDDDLPHVQSLLDSPKLCGNSALNSFLLCLVTIGIVLLGVLALGVGLIFAVPFVALMWCVAYDELRGGPASAMEE